MEERTESLEPVMHLCESGFVERTVDKEDPVNMQEPAKLPDEDTAKHV